MDANVSYPLSGLSVNNMNNQLISRVETITPVLAEEYLRRNTNNRLLRKNIVSYYAAQMRNGQWMLNGEGIIFNEENVLVDGQHRLAAVVESGADVEMLVVRNADKNSFTTIDSGVSRKIQDTFYVKGIPNANKAASIISRYKRMCRSLAIMGNSGTAKQGDTPSRQDLLLEYSSDEEFWQEVVRFACSCWSTMRLMTATEIGGFASYLIKEKKHPMEKVFFFFEQLLKVDTPQSRTISLYRKRLIQNLTMNKRISPQYNQQLFAKVWNAFVEGRELSCVKWSEQERRVELI